MSAEQAPGVHGCSSHTSLRSDMSNGGSAMTWWATPTGRPVKRKLPVPSAEANFS